MILIHGKDRRWTVLSWALVDLPSKRSKISNTIDIQKFKLIPQFKSTYVHAGHSGTAQSFLSWILIHLLHLASRQPWRMHICFIKLTTNVNFTWYSSWYCCIYDTSDCDISAYGYTCRSKEHKNMYSLYIYYYDWLSLFSQVNDGCAILGHTCNWNQL